MLPTHLPFNKHMQQTELLKSFRVVNLTFTLFVALFTNWAFKNHYVHQLVVNCVVFGAGQVVCCDFIWPDSKAVGHTTTTKFSFKQGCKNTGATTYGYHLWFLLILNAKCSLHRRKKVDTWAWKWDWVPSKTLLIHLVNADISVSFERSALSLQLWRAELAAHSGVTGVPADVRQGGLGYLVASCLQRHFSPWAASKCFFQGHMLHHKRIALRRKNWGVWSLPQNQTQVASGARYSENNALQWSAPALTSELWTRLKIWGSTWRRE